MAASLARVVAIQQWRLLVRDRRLAVLGLALLLVLVTASVTGAADHVMREVERSAAQAEEARVWQHQGQTNPRN